MLITILTMFPEMFESFLSGPLPSRAKEKGIARIRIMDIKEYAGGCYRHIDDSTFGGGAGMILRAKPVYDALDAALSADAPQKGAAPDASEEDWDDGPGGSTGYKDTIIAALTPVGVPYCQKTAERYAKLDHLILICGHYEGMDERIYSRVDERISIGDYVLSGGEIAAQAVADSVLRLLPGILREESTEEESFCGRGFLEYPQYTRPADLDGERVPEVLLSGNHEEIRKWRLRESLRATLRYRPDLMEGMVLTEEEMICMRECGVITYKDIRKRGLMTNGADDSG